LNALFAAINDKLFTKTLGENALTPTEKEIVAAIQACQRLAANHGFTIKDNKKTFTANTTESVLSLRGKSANKIITPPSAAAANEDRKLKENPPVHPIMDMAYHVLLHPFVFISRTVLKEYITLASILSDPSTIPSIFHQYSHKPVLEDPKKPPYIPNPNSAKNAIPIPTAYTALDVAITAKNMPLALQIIEESTSTTAHCRSKGIRKLLPFTTLCTLLPFGIWRLANYLATFQDTVPHEKAVGYAFTGFMAYSFLTGSLGMIALLTWNDHMIRVTWIPGVFMRERWFMEEQRLMADRVAVAWGFEDPTKRGFESGWEWDMLREWVGTRGMILDSSEMIEDKEILSEKVAARTKSLRDRRIIKF